MKSEKRKKELKCFEARIDGGDELPINLDRTSQSNPAKAKAQKRLYCFKLKKVDSQDEATGIIKET